MGSFRVRVDPIIVFCSPRGGSSLVAGIIRAHGVWVGRTFKGTEYENHENADIKTFLKTHWKFTPGIPMGVGAEANKANLLQHCRKVVDTCGPWMMKCAVEYYPIFDRWFPAMSPFLVYRKREMAIEGLVKRKGRSTLAAMTRDVDNRYSYQDHILKNDPRASSVLSDDVMRGDYRAIAGLLERYDIEFKEEIAASTLNPEIWHA